MTIKITDNNKINLNVGTNRPGAQGSTGPAGATGPQGSFDLKVPSTLLSDFDHGGHVHTASPDTASPYIVAMKLQWTNGEEIKSIRFLFVIRYQPQ